MKTIKLHNVHIPNETITVGWGDNNQPFFDPSPKDSLVTQLLYNWLNQDHATNKSDSHLTQYHNGLHQEGSFWNGVRHAVKLGFRKLHTEPHPKVDWSKEMDR